jgi:gliding motility-associated-like protein
MKPLYYFAIAALVFAACSTTKNTPTNTPEKTNTTEVTNNTPNAFTPNADGQNDELCFTDMLTQMPGALVKIYTRWGIQVWENADAQKCWNGTDDKTKAALPAGTYTYKIHPKTGNDITGTVTIIR